MAAAFTKTFTITCRMSSSPKKRQRSQGQRQRAKKESAFHDLFTKYQTEMDARNDIQERIYKSARDVIIEVSFSRLILKFLVYVTLEQTSNLYITKMFKINS